MSKRLFENNCYEENTFKKRKIHKTKLNYITIIINDNSFNDFSLDELRETSNEITIIINNILKHKEKIDNILSIYT